MAYSDNTYTADAINRFTDLISNELDARATRPQKTSVITSTTSRLYALKNMIANRDRIGQATAELNDALKAREGLGYTLANALAGIPQQQGAGSWLSDFARAFGGGMAAPTNAMVDRAQKKYEAEMKDLANILAYDKAMGDNQYQAQTIGYEPMEYGTAGKQSKGGGEGGIEQYGDLPNVKLHEMNVNAGRWDTNKYDPTDKSQGIFNRLNVKMIPGRDYGIAAEKNTEQAKSYQDFETTAMQGMFDVLKVLRPATDTDVLVALRAAGADPTLAPNVRDKRLTKTLNSELRKAGLQGITNLKNWDNAVDYLRKTNIWDPVAAEKYAQNNRKPQQTDKTTVVARSAQQGEGGQQVFMSEDGRKFILKTKGN